LDGLNVTDYTGQIPIRPNLLRNSGNAAAFFTADSINAGSDLVPLPMIRQVRFVDKEPQTLLRENFPEAYGSAGLTFAEVEPYGGERLVEVRNADGQPFLYVSLIQGTGSTVIAIWNSDPRAQTSAG
jgi:hypothetical protein